MLNFHWPKLSLPQWPYLSDKDSPPSDQEESEIVYWKYNTASASNTYQTSQSIKEERKKGSSIHWFGVPSLMPRTLHTLCLNKNSVSQTPLSSLYTWRNWSTELNLKWGVKPSSMTPGPVFPDGLRLLAVWATAHLHHCHPRDPCRAPQHTCWTRVSRVQEPCTFKKSFQEDFTLLITLSLKYNSDILKNPFQESRKWMEKRWDSVAVREALWQIENSTDPGVRGYGCWSWTN